MTYSEKNWVDLVHDYDSLIGDTYIDADAKKYIFIWPDMP